MIGGILLSFTESELFRFSKLKLLSLVFTKFRLSLLVCMELVNVWVLLEVCIKLTDLADFLLTVDDDWEITEVIEVTEESEWYISMSCC